MPNAAESKPQLEIMDFWAEWCGPCHVMKPILEEVEGHFKDRINLVKINVDEQPDLSGEYQIRSIPTMIFKKNGIVVDQIIGAVPKDLLVHKIDEHLAA